VSHALLLVRRIGESPTRLPWRVRCSTRC
jgi:hypothetical protein